MINGDIDLTENLDFYKDRPKLEDRYLPSIPMAFKKAGLMVNENTMSTATYGITFSSDDNSYYTTYNLNEWNIDDGWTTISEVNSNEESASSSTRDQELEDEIVDSIVSSENNSAGNIIVDRDEGSLYASTTYTMRINYTTSSGMYTTTSYHNNSTISQDFDLVWARNRIIDYYDSCYDGISWTRIKSKKENKNECPWSTRKPYENTYNDYYQAIESMRGRKKKTMESSKAFEILQTVNGGFINYVKRRGAGRLKQLIDVFWDEDRVLLPRPSIESRMKKESKSLYGRYGDRLAEVPWLSKMLHRIRADYIDDVIYGDQDYTSYLTNMSWLGIH